MIEGMPTIQGSLRKLVERIGCLRSTHYGHLFDIIIKPSANNLAYTGRGLGLHTDLPYYDYNPGVGVE